MKDNNTKLKTNKTKLELFTENLVLKSTINDLQMAFDSLNADYQRMASAYISASQDDREYNEVGLIRIKGFAA